MMRLDEVVPFGRSFDEYRRMFDLSEDDLEKRILGVGDGPASFNAELRALGKSMVSVDPLYVFSTADIKTRFYQVLDNIIGQVKASPDDWVWTYHASPDHLHANRVNALETFAADFENGRAEGRYVAGELPRLPFDDGQFGLALCSHFLFLYSDHYDYEFHRAAIYEMLRVASEVRIFPLLTLALDKSPHLEPLVRDLEASGYATEILTVDYQLQKGGDEMLRIYPAGA